MATLKRKSKDQDIIFDSLDDTDLINDNDDDVNSKGAASTGAASTQSTIKLKGSSTAEGGEGEVTLLKKGKKRLKVDTNRLLGIDGIKRVYEEFPIICQFKGRGSEAKYLSNLIDRYKEWSFQLYPSFEYTEVLNRTYAISKEPAMKHMVEQLRRQECDRRMRSHYGVEIPEEAYANNNNDEDNENTNDLNSWNNIVAAASSVSSATKALNNSSSNSSSTNAADLSDDMFLQAMLEFDQRASSNGATTTTTITASDTTNMRSGEGGVELSDSDEEEEEFEVTANTEVRPDTVSTESKPEEGSLDELLALDSVMDSETTTGNSSSNAVDSNPAASSNPVVTDDKQEDMWDQE